MPQILQFPKAKRQTFSDLLEPSRDCDEGLARVIRAFERSGIAVVTDDDPIPLNASMIVQPHELIAMAEYVQNTDAETRGKAHAIFENILSVWRP